MFNADLVWYSVMGTGESLEIPTPNASTLNGAGRRFTHFLDSGEQGLTVIVLFNDIKHRAGGTYIAPDAIKNVVQWSVPAHT